MVNPRDLAGKSRGRRRRKGHVCLVLCIAKLDILLIKLDSTYSNYTDTEPILRWTSPSNGLTTQGIWQDSHWNVSLQSHWHDSCSFMLRQTKTHFDSTYSNNTDTRPLLRWTSPSNGLTTQGIWQDSPWTVSFQSNWHDSTWDQPLWASKV